MATTANIPEIAGKLDITVEEGTDFSTTITWTDDLSPSTPFDLSGWSAGMQVRKTKAHKGTPRLELTTQNGGIVLGGILGTIRLIILNTQYIFGDNVFVYDLELVDPSNKVIRLLEGKFTSISEVTK